MADFSTADLARALERTSEEMKREVGALLQPTATAMVATLQGRYPVGRRPHPGRKHMREDMSIRTRNGLDALLPAQQVRGPHLAYIWQNGTAERWYVNKRGTIHNTGRAQAQDPDFFERTAVQKREQFMTRAQSILDRPREID